MPSKKSPDIIGISLLTLLFLLLAYAGYLAYQSIDWTVLKRLEATPLVLPTPLPSTAPASASANP